MIILLMITISCMKPTVKDEGQKSVILEEGATKVNPDYFVSESGEVIYKGNPSGEPEVHQSKFPPVYPNAQRIYPANDNPQERESYLIKAPLDDIRKYYEDYLDYRKTKEGAEKKLADNFAVVQTIELKDKDGRRQIALFVNKNEGSRGGMKVMLKEFPQEGAVQIVLTTLDASPGGLNPIGVYVSPEEVKEWVKQEEARKAEDKKRREEIKKQADEQEKKRKSSSN